MLFIDNKKYPLSRFGYLPYLLKGNYFNYSTLLLLSKIIFIEEELSASPLLTHCLAVVKVGDEYLLGRNKWRNRYEIFGGCREKGESSRDCILRECNEEFGFASSDITYIGAMKYLLKPDYFSKEEREELGGLYGITMPDISLEDLYSRIKDKNEITDLKFYSRVKDKEPIALIDEKLLEYYT